MDTAYKTRAWWMLTALEYFAPIAGREEYVANELDRGREPKMLDRHRGEQIDVWARQGHRYAANAVAPAGSEALTRLYVDRQGNPLAA